MPELFEQVQKSLLPKGSAWNVVPDGDWDKLISASAENFQEVKDFLSQIASFRDPDKTILLDDLEREFGILKNPSISELIRRATLKAKMYNRGCNAELRTLQNALDVAGFDVQVHSNDPAVDPALFLDQSFQMVAGGGNAYAGRADAYANRSGGELLINGEVFEQFPTYSAQANGASTFAGNSSAVSGYFSNFGKKKIIQEIPTDPKEWPLIFFVGGDATRDPGTGELTSIQLAEVPAIRKTELFKIILRIKPLNTWAALVIAFV